MKDNFGFILLGVLGLGLLYLVTRNRSDGMSESYSSRPGHTLKLKPARRYQNEETWDIQWNEDGLPTKVTIHRNAVQT